MPERNNYATKYGAWIIATEPAPGEKFFMATTVVHLPPELNRGRAAIFVRLLDEDGKRMRGGGVRLLWGWEGQRPNEAAPPVLLDKRDGEDGHGNVDMYTGQKTWVKIDGLGLKSDSVINLHTSHPDERGPNGEIWNSIGHHSYVVTFQLVTSATVTVPTVPVANDEISYEIVFRRGGSVIHTTKGTIDA